MDVPNPRHRAARKESLLTSSADTCAQAVVSLHLDHGFRAVAACLEADDGFNGVRWMSRGEVGLAT